MKKFSKLAILLTTLSASIVASVSLTTAYFVTSKSIGNYAVGAGGKRNFDTVFLDPGTWRTGDGTEDILVYMWKAGKDSILVAPKRIQNSGYYTYQLDLSYYTDDNTNFFMFVRMNPNISYNMSSYESLWNSTDDFKKTSYSTNNVYSITGWGTVKIFGDEHSNTKSTGSWNLNVT